ncbi:MAG: CARDB domain-containing protein, partial [Poseidonia sp.]
DAQPLALDTDEDGIDDRLCWVTWYSEESFNFNRKGMLGCTDISDSTPVTEWTRDLQRGAGNDNDEIAASPPFWLDIDGEGTPEILVGFGRRFWAFDGDTGASADINDEWSTPLSMPHRVWTAPAVADIDGDGHIDVLFGDTLVSNRGVDLTPALDNRGLSFNPAQADPGQTVTVTGQFANVGTSEADEDVDAAIIMNGVELHRERFTSSDPVAPSGEGGPLTFSADFVAELGVHEFELVLDVNNNITEQREDNNLEFMQFSVVEPYLAELIGPLDPPRIPPGTSQQVDVQLMATGSKTADWMVSYDDSQLPEGWTFEVANNAALARELIPNVPDTLTFDASVPSTALGDESGHVTLTLTLVSDPTVNTTIELQLDVFRTRGLDLTGASGMNTSTGHGRPGQTAKAWFMVENLGNAPESTTSITWTAPSWGGSPSIHDASGQQLFSIALNPGETKVLLAHLDTPSSTSYGSSTQSTLTMCMGSGEDALCESMPFTFIAHKVVAEPTHHRTLPGATLTWSLQGIVPTSGAATWNMNAMGMLETGWIWSTTGDLSINGSNLMATGTAGNVFSGDLTLQLPPNAIPKRHTFAATDALDGDAQFNVSLHVLQIFRANVDVIEPTPSTPGQPIALNVSEAHRFLLSLENPGNGEDSFLLSATARSVSESTAPEVQFTYYDPQKTLGPLSTGIGTIDVVLSSEIPALTPFFLDFTWTSLGGENVHDVVSIEVQAAQSHEWSVLAINETSVLGVPGQTLEFGFNLTNLGNAADALTLRPELQQHPFGNDASSWAAAEVETTTVAVNGTTELVFSVVIPQTAWATSSVDIRLLHVANGYVLGETALSVEVDAVSGWKLNLTEADLEVDPEGENLTFTLIHTGNAYEQPYFAKAGAGWNITLPENVAAVAPYATSTFVVHVQPPENAIAGEVGVLRIRITGNDTSGLVVEEIPVRVGASPQIVVDHRGVWSVNEQGGYPTAWIENQGNDIAMLTVDLDGLPEGWSTQQGSQVILAPGEVAGIPLSLVPASDWNQQRMLLTINVNHPLLGVQGHSIEVEHSRVSFSSTPIVDAYLGTEQSVLVSTVGGETVAFGGPLNVETTSQAVSFIQPSSTGEYLLTWSSDGADGNLSIYAVARQYPDSSIACQFLEDAFDRLGQAELEGTAATCRLTAGATEELRAVFTLVNSIGERIGIEEESLVVGEGQDKTFNITLEGWDPEPGVFDVMLTGYDQYGRTLADARVSVVAREQGWNVGISSLTSNGDINIGIKRSGYGLLEDAVCELLVEAEGGWATTYIVDVAYAEFAPVVQIKNPSSIERDEKITATLACSLPFDVDDDPEDDTMSTYYKPANVLAVSSSDIGWIIGVAGLVVAIAWLLGAVQVGGKKQAQTPPAKQKAQHPTPAGGVEEASYDKAPSDEDDMQLELVSAPDEEPAIEDDSEVEASQPMVEVFEEIETAPEPVDATASGRLASLREEMGGDDVNEREGTLEDRMKKFFGGSE